MPGHLDQPRRDEPSRAEQQMQAARREQLQMVVHHALHDFCRARGDAGHVDAHALRHCTKGRGMPHQLDYAGAAHQSFGRDAGDVDTSTANHADLDKTDILPGLGAVHGQRLAGLAAA
jgi:hypothetical protein